MTASRSPDAIRFYFSFRSPYAWLATESLDEELGDLGVPLERIPIYPTPGDFPNDPTAVPNKGRYIVQDVARLTRERGLKVTFPRVGDPDWSLSHAAFLGAEQQGAGAPFMLEVFRKRFCEGLDLGEDDVIGDAARAAGLDPSSILEAAHSDSLRAEAEGAWRRAGERDGIFGVPSFVYAGKLYWGQDRMRFLAAAVRRKRAV